MNGVIKIYAPDQTLVLANPNGYSISDEGHLSARPSSSDAYTLGSEIVTNLPFLIMKKQ
jgi:hypothetical protein